MSNYLEQQRVSAAHVMVVGCGALGNEVLKNLVLLGVEHLVVVDFDVVEIGNLSRSVLFSKADAETHRLKVEVVAERLKAMNSAIEIQTICGDVAYDVGLSLVRRMDVVIGCVDSRWARYCINRMCMRANIPWVDGAIEELEGTARVFIPGKNCYACNLGPEGLREMTMRMSCAGVIRRHEQAGSVPTTSLMASVIGAVQVQEAMKLVHQEALEQGTFTSLSLRQFHQMLGAKSVTIYLENDCFVDYVEERANDRRTEVMCPGHAVEAFVEADPHLSGIPLSGLYQHEYKEIGVDFPYGSLTLAQLGIPSHDVLHVVADGQDYYFELREQWR